MWRCFGCEHLETLYWLLWSTPPCLPADAAVSVAGEIAFARRPERPSQLRASHRVPELETPVGGAAANEGRRSPEGVEATRQDAREALTERNLPAGAMRQRKPLRSRLAAALGSASGPAKSRRNTRAVVPAVRDSSVVNVRFSIQFHVDYGQCLRVVGSHEALGEV